MKLSANQISLLRVSYADAHDDPTTQAIIDAILQLNSSSPPKQEIAHEPNLLDESILYVVETLIEDENGSAWTPLAFGDHKTFPPALKQFNKMKKAKGQYRLLKTHFKREIIDTTTST